MLLKAPEPAINGQTPISPATIARARGQLGRDALAMARAKFAVLGYCTPPASFSAGGVNLVSDVARTQSVQRAASSTAAAGASSGGAGGFASLDTLAGPAVYPMGSADTVPVPAYPPLTTTQGPGVPVVAIPAGTPLRAPACRRGSRLDPLAPGGAGWGSASAARGSQLLGVPSAAWVAAGLLALLALGTAGRQ